MKDPFRHFNSSPEVIRLTVMRYNHSGHRVRSASSEFDELAAEPGYADGGSDNWRRFEPSSSPSPRPMLGSWAPRLS